MGIEDLYEDKKPKCGDRLEGTPPTIFDGDRKDTTLFLKRFKQFMVMNRGSAIASDPFKKCAYFVGLIAGPCVDGWVERNLNWLNAAKADSTEIPAGMTAWQVMEADF